MNKPMETQSLYDVVAVRIASGIVRVMTRNLSEANAEGYVSMAVIRRGVNEEFFSGVPAGKYQDGDSWAGDGLEEL